MTSYRMIKALCILFSLLVFKLACSQDYLVTVTNDTLQGEVKLLNFGPEPKVQLAEPGEKGKTTYSILQVRAFQLDNEIYHTVRTQTGYMFMKLISGGYLSLYSFDSNEQPQWGGRYLATLDGKTMEVPNLGFRKRLTAFTNDCPSVSKDIENGNLTKSEIEKIVANYNECIANRTAKTIQETTKPLAKNDHWSALERAVSDHNDFDGKDDVLEMIRDIRLKTSRSEKIPNFLLEGLRNSLKDQPNLAKQLEAALQAQDN